MGRPRIPLGTYGKVTFVDLPSGQVQARVRFRDYDGQVRLIGKVGRTRAGAERSLKVEMTTRQTQIGRGALRADTRVHTLADAWLGASHNWSTGTERTYRSVVRKQLKPAFGDLSISEVSPGVVNRRLSVIAKESGPSTAKSVRACLSGMFGLAIQDGAVAINPVRDSGARLHVNPKAPKALTREETRELATLFRSSERANELDLPDVVDWMLATGCRIGEALALRYDANNDGKPLIDLEAATWEINATIVRVEGKGLIVQPRPKSAAGWRVIAVPAFAVNMLRVRRGDAGRSVGSGIVFRPPRTGSLRDPSNVSGDLRELLDGFDCDVCAGTGFRRKPDGSFEAADNGRRIRCAAGPWSWVTSHTFRKTVATRLDEAGFTARQVADQLGHANPSMTLDVYFGRQVVSAATAKVLDR